MSKLYGPWVGRFFSLKSSLAALLILGGFWVGYPGYRDAQALADHGKDTQAIVDNVRWKVRQVRGDTSVVGFKLDIRFETEDKQIIHARVDVSDALGSAFSKAMKDGEAHGYTIAVRYLPQQPQILVLDGEQGSSQGQMAIGAALLAVGAAIVLVQLLGKTPDKKSVEPEAPGE